MALRAVVNEVKANQDGQNLNLQVQILDENDIELKVFVLTQGPDNVSEQAILDAIGSFTKQHLEQVAKETATKDAVVAAEAAVKTALEGKTVDLTDLDKPVVLKK